MFIIDYRDRRPIYEQIIDKMEDLIFRGALEEDSQLPSVRSLATDLSINPNTIQRAYAELERQGYIYSVKGKGSFVAGISETKQLKQRQIYEKLECLIDEARSIPIPMLEFQEHVIQCYANGEKKEDIRTETGGENV